MLLVSVDTLHRDFLGVHGPPWDVTPRIDALMAEGARLDHVIVPRGLSGPSMASLVTGAYPRTHGVRINDHTVGAEGVSADTLTLGERFAAAGYAGAFTFLSTDFHEMLRRDEFRPRRFMLVFGLHLGGYVGALLGTLAAVVQVRRNRRGALTDSHHKLI